VCDNAASLSLLREDRVQKNIFWDEKSVVFAGLKCEDLLAHGTGIQAIFPPQTI
jgi:hypothetical protein